MMEPQSKSHVENSPEEDTLRLPSLPLRQNSSIKLKTLNRDGFLEEDTARFSREPGELNGGTISTDSSNIHVSGLSRDGSLIEAKGFIHKGKRHGDAQNMPEVYLGSKEEVKSILGLKIKDPNKGIYSRTGFTGHYKIQREMDGSYSVFYSGGMHRQGTDITRLPPQTFHHGVWDVDRKSALNTITPQREKKRAGNFRELKKTGEDLLSRSDNDSSSGFYSENGSFSKTDQADSKRVFDYNPNKKIKLDATFPAGSNVSDILARRDLSNPVKVEIDGKDAAYVFLRSVGVLKGVLFVRENDRDIPGEVMEGYRNAHQEDGRLTTDVWIRSSSDSSHRTMLRSDGSVLIDKGERTGIFTLIAPDFRDLGGDKLSWMEVEVRKGEISQDEPDFVETRKSREKRRAKTQDNGFVEQEREIVKSAVLSLISGNEKGGYFVLKGISVDADKEKRARIIEPFVFNSKNGEEHFVFPRKFHLKSSNEMVSGVLTLTPTEIERISEHNPQALKYLKTALGAIRDGRGTDKWVDLEGEDGQVNIRSDGSFVYRESSQSETASVFKTRILSDGSIGWTSIKVYQDSNDDYTAEPPDIPLKYPKIPVESVFTQGLSEESSSWGGQIFNSIKKKGTDFGTYVIDKVSSYF